MNKLTICLVASSCLLGVVACGSDIDDDNDGGMTPTTVTQWGLIDIDTEDEVEISALFGRFETEFLVSEYQEELIPELEECEVDTVSPDDGDDGDDDLEIEFSVGYEFVSVGDSISIDSPAGSYVNLFKEANDESIIYTVESGSAIAGPAPNSLSASITGDVFPAFAAVAIPDVAELDFSSPMEGEMITATTQFLWNQGGVSNSYVSISASYVDEDLTEVSVECTVIDDGEFSLPLSIQQELGAEFSTESADFSRTSYSFTTANGASLAIRNTIDI